MTMTPARTDTISDYFRLDDELTADEISVRDKVRAFAEQRVLPVINEYWEKAEFPYELLPGLAELGIVGTTIRGYGCPGMSRKAAGMVAREMARADGSMNTFLGVHSNLCMGPSASWAVPSRGSVGCLRWRASRRLARSR